MKTKIKVIIAISVGLLGMLVIINYLFNKNISKNDLEIQITNETVVSSTTIRKTTKKSKKVVKTTQKKKTVKTASYSEYQKYAAEYGNYNQEQMSCLINLWNKESGWNPNSYNKKSGACGIPQAKPCKKIKEVEGSNDWQAQIRWGVKYITYRYKTPCKAWKKFLERNPHWY